MISAAYGTSLIPACSLEGAPKAKGRGTSPRPNYKSVNSVVRLVHSEREARRGSRNRPRGGVDGDGVSAFGCSRAASAAATYPATASRKPQGGETQHHDEAQQAH